MQNKSLKMAKSTTEVCLFLFTVYCSAIVTSLPVQEQLVKSADINSYNPPLNPSVHQYLPAHPFAPAGNPNGPVAPVGNPSGPVAPVGNPSGPVAPVGNPSGPVAPVDNPSGTDAPVDNPDGPVAPTTSPAELSSSTSTEKTTEAVTTTEASSSTAAPTESQTETSTTTTTSTTTDALTVTEPSSIGLKENQPTESAEENTKKSEISGKDSVGTMPRFGKAFGPWRPPSTTSTEAASESFESEPKEEIKSESVQDPIKNYYPRLPPPQAIFPGQLPYDIPGPRGPQEDYVFSYNVPGFIDEEAYDESKLIEGEFGYQGSDGVLRGIRYTAHPRVPPRLLYETLVTFLAL